MKQVKIAKKSVLPVLAILLIIGLGVFGGYYFKKYQDLKNNPADPTEIAKMQNAKTISEVKELYKLPDGEEPTIFTVVDTEKLKEQYPALSAAEKDDKVLLYTNAKVAIVYRPKDKKIVSVVNVTIAQKVAIRIVGTQAARDAVKKTLGEKFGDAVELKSEAEAKATPTATVVADVSGQQSQLAQQIAASISGASVGTLPEGEEKPSDTAIVIVAAESTPVTPAPAP